MKENIECFMFTETFLRTPSKKANFKKIIDALPEYSQIDWERQVSPNLSTNHKTFFTAGKTRKISRQAVNTSVDLSTVYNSLKLKKRIQNYPFPKENKPKKRRFRPYSLNNFKALTEKDNFSFGGLGSEVGSEKWIETNVNYAKKTNFSQKVKKRALTGFPKIRPSISPVTLLQKKVVYSKQVKLPKAKKKTKPLKVVPKEGTYLNLVAKHVVLKRKVKQIKKQICKMT